MIIPESVTKQYSRVHSESERIERSQAALTDEFMFMFNQLSFHPMSGRLMVQHFAA
jgi:hypothetical protein